MKLRNKKTGEIREVIVGGYPVSGKTKMWECSEMDANEETGYKSLGTYTSLAELNEEWEDAPEEPKDYWRISLVGADVDCVEDVKDEIDQYNKEIGNYFETKEEAEKAVKKLKAWKRLKDKGFKFCKDWTYRYDQPKVEDHTYFEFVAICEDGILFDDLDLLFLGGEE